MPNSSTHKNQRPKEKRLRCGGNKGLGGSNAFFDPTPEEEKVVLVDAVTIHEAERQIESCEHCNLEGAEIPFDAILDRVTRSDPSVTDYILEQPAKCPNCRREILEKTLIEPVQGDCLTLGSSFDETL